MMTHKTTYGFGADFFNANRQRLLTLLQDAHGDVPFVATAAGLLQKAGDNTYPFHQDSNFWYLTGISEPDLLLIIAGGEEYLVVPGRSASREAFDGALDSAELTRISGIGTIMTDDEADGLLAELLRGSQGRVATPLAPPTYIEQYGMYTNPARAALSERLARCYTSNAVKPVSKHAADGLTLLDARPQLAALRVIKQPAELAAIQRAIDITIDSLELLTAPRRFGDYAHEYEFEADLGREFRFRGASGHAFAPIVASGKRACTLHNVANNGAFEADSFAVLDVGAEVDHYAADITRTRVYGAPSKRQQQVFDAVLAVQNYALTLLKPGARMKDYEQAVETYMGATLQKLGLLKKGKVPERADIRRYYPHATSHFLGLDVHDVGDYVQPLQAGMVLTCEPGIYIPDEGIGVRIEDDILITATGNTVLSDRLPRTLN